MTADRVHEPDPSIRSGPTNIERLLAGLEKWLAPLVMLVPLLYLLPYHSFAPPVFLHYSAKVLAAIGIYGLLFALFLMSYRWNLPAIVVRLRSYSVLLGVWMLVGLVVLEVSLATFAEERPDVQTVRLRGYQADPELGYVYEPNWEQELVFPESVTQWRTNAIGIRADRDYGPKLDGVIRIVALGDSFTVAAASDFQDAWPGVLERLLNERVPGDSIFEVVNAGHAGWGTMQQAKWLARHGDQLEPDAVILAMTPNDINDNEWTPPGAFTAVDGYLTSINTTDYARHRFEHLQRWYSLQGLFERSRVREGLKQADIRFTGISLMPAFSLELGERERRMHDLTEGYLLDIREWTESRGIDFGLMFITFREQLGDMAPGYSPEAFGQRWAAFARLHGIPTIDTLKHVRELPDPQSLFFRWDNHYSSVGERFAGQIAFELMSDLTLEE